MHALIKPEVWKLARALKSHGLTDDEATNVRRALRFLRMRAGSARKLAIALGVGTKAMENALVPRGRPSALLALRGARLAGVAVEAVLDGAWPPEGACPHCGRCGQVNPAPGGAHLAKSNEPKHGSPASMRNVSSRATLCNKRRHEGVVKLNRVVIHPFNPERLSGLKSCNRRPYKRILLDIVPQMVSGQVSVIAFNLLAEVPRVTAQSGGEPCSTTTFTMTSRSSPS